MGRRKTVVSCSAAKLFGDEPVPDIIKTNILKYILGTYGASSVADVIIQEVPNALQTRLRRTAKWADRNGNYNYGVPKANFTVRNAAAIDTFMDNYLKDLYGEDTQVIYTLNEDAHLFHMAWAKLKTLLGYSVTTNKLNVLSAAYESDCYLENGTVKYCTATVSQMTDPASFEQFGLAFNYGATLTRTRDYTRIPSNWVEEAVLDKDIFEYSFSYKVVETRTVKKNAATNVIISDEINYVGVMATTYESVVTTDISSTETTEADVTTTVTIKEHLFVLKDQFDFLDIEFSGSIDESGALGDGDTDLIDPDAEDNTDVVPIIDKEYLQIGFTYLNAGNLVYDYFTYEQGSNSIPKLENVIVNGLQFGSYAPRIYCRSRGVKLNQASRRNLPEFKSSRRLCNRLGLDYDELTDSLHNSIGSLNKVKQIAIATVVPIHSLSKPQIIYWWNWLDKFYLSLDPNPMHNRQNGLDKAFLEQFSDYAIRAGKFIKFFDVLYENRIAIHGLGRKITNGVICPVGDYVNEIRNVTNSYTYILSALTGTTAKKNLIAPCFIFHKQINETQYESFAAYSPFTQEVVQAGYVHTSKDYDETLLFPVDLEILEFMNFKERQQFIGEALYVMVNTSQTIKKRWYQTGIFAALIFVIAVGLSLYSGGGSLSLLAITKAVVVAVVKIVVLNVVVTILVQVFNLDPEVAALLYVIASIASGGVDLSSLTATAKDLILILNDAARIATLGVEMEYKELLKNQEQFAATAAEQLKYLEEAEELLRQTEYVYDPLYSGSSNKNKFFYSLGETPDEYLSKQQYSLDIPSLVFSTISKYTDQVLTLPEPRLS